MESSSFGDRPTIFTTNRATGIIPGRAIADVFSSASSCFLERHADEVERLLEPETVPALEHEPECVLFSVRFLPSNTQLVIAEP